MEYKYTYLLVECKCGVKFHPRESERGNDKCRNCNNPVRNCMDCYEPFMTTKFNLYSCDNCGYNEYYLGELRECELCGISDFLETKSECHDCVDLEERGKFTINGITYGFPNDEEGICVWCDNRLYNTSGPYGPYGPDSNCVCYGCDIEPLNCMMIKPAISRG